MTGVALEDATNLVRYSMNVATGEVLWTPLLPQDFHSVDFPIIPPQLVGRHARYTYTTIVAGSSEGGMCGSPLSSLPQRVDTRQSAIAQRRPMSCACRIHCMLHTRMARAGRQALQLADMPPARSEVTRIAGPRAWSRST